MIKAPSLVPSRGPSPIRHYTAAALTLIGLSLPAWAGTYSATQTGTVHVIQQNSTLQSAAETYVFALDGQAGLPCGNYFVVSPNTTTDQQTRRNLVALVMLAKATGAQIEVAYDSSGGTPCDQGMTPVYWLEVL